MKIIYFIPLILFSCVTKPKKEETIKSKELNPIHIDTTQKKFPIKVTEVHINTDEKIKQKYVVCTEIGLMFYTDIETKVGDTAFYDTEVYSLID